MDRIVAELRSALRTIVKNPGFAAAAILSIGLGAGATTAIFSVLDAVVLRPLPYAEPDRLVAVWETNAGKGLERERISPVNFVDYRALGHVFADAAAWWNPEVNLTDAGKEATRVPAIEASGNFFDVLGVAPILGAGFPRLSPGAELHGPARDVVISHRLWQQRYAGDPSIVGRTIPLGGVPHTVLGVMPATFDYPRGNDLWIRLIWPLARHSRGAHFMEGVARLAPAVSVETAEREIAALTTRLGREFAGTNGGWTVRLVPLDRDTAGIFRPALIVLLASVSLLLLVACLNVANLLLARATVREREIAIRAALGASRRRLLVQFLTESLAIAIASGLVGLAVALASTRLLVAAAPIDIPRLDRVVLDARVFAFALGLTVLTTLAFGLLPALFLSRPDLQSWLKSGGRATGGSRGGLRARRLLVVAEVGLAVALVFVAGLLIRSFVGLTAIQPGFQPAHAITASLHLPETSYRSWEQVSRFYATLLANLADHPAVQEAGASNFLPLTAGWRIPASVIGAESRTGDTPPAVQHVSVSERYFASLGVRLLRGRSFAAHDTVESNGVVILNEAAVRLFFRGVDPIGSRIVSTARNIGPLGRAMLPRLEYEVIGVVTDVRNTSLGEPAEPALYFSHRQFPFRAMHLVVRARAHAAPLAAIVREEVRRVDPTLPVSNAEALDAYVGHSTEQPRFLMLMMAIFAALALGLASLGIYGLLAYLVGQRRTEIGIRMALGAGRGSVVWLVLRQGGLLALGGAALGVAAALALGRGVSALLFGVPPHDLPTLAGVLAVVTAIATLACLLPARRAARIDPQAVLRAE
jgi:putative ABC transport system permease protein